MAKRILTVQPLARSGMISVIGWTAFVAFAGAVLTGHASASVVLVLAVVAGLPHGATDALSGYQVFKSFGRFWWQPFLAGYIGLIALVLGAWAVAPTFMLAAFLLLSVIHFGMQDASGAPACRSWFTILAHGGAPIVIPALFHPSEVERLFAILAGGNAVNIEALLAGPLAGLWLLAITLTVCRATQSTERTCPSSSIRLLLVIVLFAVSSPLIAFGLYFALLHTPWALLAQHERGIRPSRIQRTSLSALACLLGLGIFIADRRWAVDANIARTSFMLLSALTVPHMALEYLFGQSCVVKRQGADRGFVALPTSGNLS